MNRRFFLGASLAVVGSVFVPKYAGWYRQGTGEPHLWGDGLHDDTHALQWRIDRAQYNCFFTGPQVRNHRPILTMPWR